MSNEDNELHSQLVARTDIREDSLLEIIDGAKRHPDLLEALRRWASTGAETDADLDLAGAGLSIRQIMAIERARDHDVVFADAVSFVVSLREDPAETRDYLIRGYDVIGSFAPKDPPSAGTPGKA